MYLKKSLFTSTLLAASLVPLVAISQPAQAQGRHAQCPILTSTWQAKVDAMPGPRSRPKLIVTGNVSTPTDGYRIGLARGPLVGSTQHFTLHVRPPRGAAAEIIASKNVRSEVRAARDVKRVSISCRGRVIGTARVTWAY